MLCWWKWCEVLIKFGEKIIFLWCSAVPDHDRKLECEIFFCISPPCVHNYDADVVHNHRQLIALQAREISFIFLFLKCNFNFVLSFCHRERHYHQNLLFLGFPILLYETLLLTLFNEILCKKKFMNLPRNTLV